MMEEFEEQFPSLKVSPIRWKVDKDNNIKLFDVETGIELQHPVECWAKNDIKKACLDKERVRETILNELNDMSMRKARTGNWCYYKTPKEEAVALCVRLLNGLQIMSPEEIVQKLNELGLNEDGVC